MRFRPLAILTLLAALALTASASAARVPPGNAGAVQYTETLPGPGGEEASGQPTGSKQPTSGGQGSGSENDAVSGATASELRDLGTEGEAALNLANANGDGGGGGSAQPKLRGSDWSGSEGSSGFGEVLGGAILGTSTGGLGFLQPLILVAVVLAAGAYLLRRRGEGQTRL